MFYLEDSFDLWLIIFSLSKILPTSSFSDESTTGRRQSAVSVETLKKILGEYGWFMFQSRPVIEWHMNSYMCTFPNDVNDQ
ncbi:MAG: hypothetical protein MJA29_12215 [Candidatus Omnitrophica bacterium]|nr:hypothetical protein [Candidatus Omnitrophota bacterium]